MLSTMSVLLLILAPTMQPGTPGSNLISGLFSPGIPLAESDLPIHDVALKLRTFTQGRGEGTLELGRNPPAYTELGFTQGTTGNTKPLQLECSVTLLRKVKVAYHVGNVREEEWSLYSITGPKITSKLSLAALGNDLNYGRFLIHGKEGKVIYAVGINTPPQAEPCHPGCFPAGTRVSVGDGTVAIETLKAGDKVTSVSTNGRATVGVVKEVFITQNKLVEVRTTDGTAVTTDAQPFLLVDGTFRRAGELKRGDLVLKWRENQQVRTEVQSVVATERQERVFNLILKDTAAFVAGGFVVRGKPRAEEGTSQSR